METEAPAPTESKSPDAFMDSKGATEANPVQPGMDAAKPAGANEPKQEQTEKPKKTPPPKNPLPGDLDERGQRFDPEIHEPQTTTKGRWKMKRGHGAKKARAAQGKRAATKLVMPEGVKDEPEEPTENRETDPELAAEAAKRAADNRLAAAAAAGTMFQLAQGAFGPDWKPTTEEAEAIVGNFESVFAMHEIKYGPKMALAVSVLGYSVQRFNKPETRSRFGRLKDKIKAGWFWFRSRGGGKKPDPKPAQSPVADEAPASGA